jgi:hypothetical protein
VALAVWLEAVEADVQKADCAEFCCAECCFTKSCWFGDSRAMGKIRTYLEKGGLVTISQVMVRNALTSLEEMGL